MLELTMFFLSAALYQSFLRPFNVKISINSYDRTFYAKSSFYFRLFLTCFGFPSMFELFLHSRTFFLCYDLSSVLGLFFLGHFY